MDLPYSLGSVSYSFVRYGGEGKKSRGKSGAKIQLRNTTQTAKNVV
jgi:hypothetical protein